MYLWPKKCIYQKDSESNVKKYAISF